MLRHYFLHFLLKFEIFSVTIYFEIARRFQAEINTKYLGLWFLHSTEDIKLLNQGYQKKRTFMHRCHWILFKILKGTSPGPIALKFGTKCDLTTHIKEKCRKIKVYKCFIVVHFIQNKCIYQQT